MHRALYYLFFLSFLPLGVVGQNLVPPVYNYRIFEYKGASKNWGLAVNGEGELFVANHMGLLHFNGEQWSLNKLPNKTIIRSVACVDDKIYTGSYEEFGFWQKNDLGLLEYTSLTHLISGHTFTSEEFWEIVPFKESILLRTFSSIYIYENDTVTVVDPYAIMTDIVIKGDRAIIGGGSDGLFELIDKKLVPLENQDLLRGKTITDMTLLGNDLLIGTKLSGCYIFREDRLSPWETELNNELKQQQLNKMIKLDTGKIAFGTIKNGIYFYDVANGEVDNLNKKTGLQNNTVLSMGLFREQLWVGLDNGIDRIKLNHPITYFTDFSGVLGTVYDIALYQGRLYLGSNTGIYYFQEDELRFVNGSQGHVWDLEVVDGDLLCGHNTGTFKIEQGKLQRISNIAGGYEIAKVPQQGQTHMQGTYSGLAKYEKENTESWQVERVRGIDFPVKQLCFENPSTIWVAHPYKGFHRVQVDEGYNNILNSKEFDQSVIPNNYNIKLYNIKNQIVFCSEGTWYKYDPILDSILPFKEFEPYKNMQLIHHDDYFWFVDNEGNKEIIYTDFKNDSLVIADPQLRQRLVPESQNIIKSNDSTFFFTLGDGFGKIELFKLRKQLQHFVLPTPKLSSFRDEKKPYPLQLTAIEIPYKDAQEVTIKVTSPALIEPRYYYELSGSEAYSSYVDGGTISFQNLPYGDYQLQVSTVSMDNKTSVPKTISFSIASPWYLSRLSIALYLVLIIAGIALVRGYNRRKLSRKEQELMEEMQKEHEKRLDELEKEKLAKEIKQKQKELAGTTLNIAKKNEMLLELKNMLVLNKDKFSNSQRYRSFVKRLDNSVKDKEDWKRFELNFKELHEDFFERLLKEYPRLTPKDLKLCAYLKMNLSTKEIAPLMAITIRGVEIHRYRLRKKLRIDSSENLSNFLITF